MYESLTEGCKLCRVVKKHAHEGQNWVLVNCPRHYVPMLVAVEHNFAFDPRQPAISSLITAAHTLLGGGVEPDNPRYVYRVQWQLDTTDSKTGHVRIHFKYIMPYSDMPIELADAITAVATEACKWFWEGKVLAPTITKTPISDQDAKDEIQGFQYAMDREIARIHQFEYEGRWFWRFAADWRKRHREWIKKWEKFEANQTFSRDRRLDLEKLPWNIQRAMVTGWRKLWEDWEDRYDPHALTPEQDMKGLPLIEVPGGCAPVSPVESWSTWLGAM